MKKLLLPVLGLMLILPFGAAGAKETGDCAGLKRIFPSGVSEENGVCKLDIPRKGLEVRHTGASMSPAMMELAFMANFEKSGPHSAVMGEFALLEKEVNPVIDALLQGGLEITALHNHMMGENPRIMYLHFQGMGDMNSLAQAVKNVIDKTVQGSK